MEAKLIVVGGKTTKREIALKPPAIIGRSREATLTIAHPMISRQHCEITEVDGLLKLRDLGSLNGTTYEEQRIVEAYLPPGAEFQIGPLTFCVQYEYDGDLDAIPAPVFAEREPEEAGQEEATVATSAADEGEEDLWNQLGLSVEDEEEPAPSPPPRSKAKKGGARDEGRGAGGEERGTKGEGRAAKGEARGAKGEARGAKGETRGEERVAGGLARRSGGSGSDKTQGTSDKARPAKGEKTREEQPATKQSRPDEPKVQEGPKGEEGPKDQEPPVEQEKEESPAPPALAEGPAEEAEELSFDDFLDSPEVPEELRIDDEPSEAEGVADEDAVSWVEEADDTEATAMEEQLPGKASSKATGETDEEQEAPSPAAGAAEEEEGEEEPSEEDAEESESPKKKRSWWPFGRGKKEKQQPQKAAARPASKPAEPEAAEEQSEAEEPVEAASHAAAAKKKEVVQAKPSATPVKEKAAPAKGKAAKKPAPPPPVEFEFEEPSKEPEEGGSGGLDSFLRGLQ